MSMNYNDEDDEITSEIGTYEYKRNEPKFTCIQDILRESVKPKIVNGFENDYCLYRNMDITLKLQISDTRKRTYVTRKDEEQLIYLLVINFGLHLKGSQNKYLYGIIAKDYHQQHPSLWNVQKFLSEEEIQKEYKLDPRSLPQRSQMDYLNFDEDSIKTDIGRLIDNDNYEPFESNNEQNITNNGYKLVIDRSEWLKSCKQSLNNDDLPLIPVLININNDGQHDIGYIKIIYIESKDIYAGIQFEQSLLPQELIMKYNIPKAITQYIHQYAQKLSFVSDLRYICAESISILPSEMDKYNRWASDIKICDLDNKITTIANRFNCDPDHVIKCFNKHIARKEFSRSLKTEYNIKQGTTLKIFDNLKAMNLTTLKLGDIQLHDFSDYWAKVKALQQVTIVNTLERDIISNQETIDELKEEISELQYAQIQDLQQELMGYKQLFREQQMRNQELEQDINRLRQERQRILQNINIYNSNYHQQPFINYQSNIQQETYRYPHYTQKSFIQL